MQQGRLNTWLSFRSALPPKVAQFSAGANMRVFRLAQVNPGQHRVLDGGVVEMEIDYGPGYRVYFTRRGARVILLPAGGDKAKQQRDIELAQRLAKEWQPCA